jgi:hypothetical protein
MVKVIAEYNGKDLLITPINLEIRKQSTDDERTVEWTIIGPQDATFAMALFDHRLTNPIESKQLQNGKGTIKITVSQLCPTGTYPYAIYCSINAKPAQSVVQGIMAEGHSHPVMIVTNSAI